MEQEQLDKFLLANELAALSHKTKPFSWNEIRSHLAWMIQHKEHIKPGPYHMDTLNKSYSNEIMAIVKQIKQKEKSKAINKSVLSGVPSS